VEVREWEGGKGRSLGNGVMSSGRNEEYGMNGKGQSGESD